MQPLNQRGIAHPFIALMVSLFILISLWYVYKSYEQKRLKENILQVYSDYRTWALTVVKDAKKDKEKVEGLFREIVGIVAKHQPGTTAMPSCMNPTKR